jgi:hypothetical protein
MLLRKFEMVPPGVASKNISLSNFKGLFECPRALEARGRRLFRIATDRNSELSKFFAMTTVLPPSRHKFFR